MTSHTDAEPGPFIVPRPGCACGLRADWARTLGEDRLDALEQDLRTMAPGGAFRLDAAGWFTG
ncbi:hypothetical protein [Streptomyces sp. NPDC006856]|uniref:hypothetical protein n=1 Tax=unclassified Streptomyces TaxID=2593676 RepID=UPI00368A90D5